MPHIHYRRRGTAIVDTKHGILLTGGHSAGKKRPFILPGGGAKRRESRFLASMRELTEETGLRPYFAQIIFTHTGKINHTHNFQDHHTVCLIRATGHPKPGGGDAHSIAYYHPGCHVWISSTTREIIERYYKWKEKNQAPLTSEIADDDAMEEEAYDPHFNGDYDTDESAPPI